VPTLPGRTPHGDRRDSTLVALTFLAWTVIVAAAGWVLVALGWWLVAHLWLTHVFVPWAVSLTTRLFLFLTLWGFALEVAINAWRLYNRRRYHARERRRLEPLPVTAERWAWSETVTSGGDALAG